MRSASECGSLSRSVKSSHWATDTTSNQPLKLAFSRALHRLYARVMLKGPKLVQEHGRAGEEFRFSRRQDGHLYELRGVVCRPFCDICPEATLGVPTARSELYLATRHVGIAKHEALPHHFSANGDEPTVFLGHPAGKGHKGLHITPGAPRHHEHVVFVPWEPNSSEGTCSHLCRDSGFSRTPTRTLLHQCTAFCDDDFFMQPVPDQTAFLTPEAKFKQGIRRVALTAGSGVPPMKFLSATQTPKK